MHFYELSGENYDFSMGELAAALETLDPGHEIVERDYPVVVVKGATEVGRRLGLCHNVYQHLFSCHFDELDGMLASGILDSVPEGLFRVRAIIKAELPMTKRGMESLIGKHIAGKVDLENPDQDVWAIAQDRIHVGILRTSVDRKGIDRRKVQNRPFFSPISVHPKYARALVNLARVKPGETLLDPFCGTGGIVIEAAAMGMDTVGSDLKPDMVEGTRHNLEHFGVSARIFQCDVREIADRMGTCTVDGIAADPPYGRSSSTNGKDATDVIEWGFQAMADVLKPGGFAAVVLPSQEMVELGEEYLQLVESYPIRIHRSLTRHFCAYRNG
jgi:tRNA (guanine10-N2)-dimethyltransferase